MKSDLARIRTSLDTLSALVLSLPDIPKEALTHFCLHVGSDAPVITCTIYGNDTRETLLALCGELFGTRGWTSKLDRYSGYYDWRKEHQGVQIKIDRAKLAPLEEGDIPVAPTEFPLLLRNPRVEEDYIEQQPPADVLDNPEIYDGPGYDNYGRPVL